MPDHTSPHIPVLLNEVINTFDIALDSKNTREFKESSPLIIDCTLGFGGHTTALLEKYQNLHIIGIDRDADSISHMQNLAQRFKGRLRIMHSNFGSEMPKILNEVLRRNDIKLRGILADIGVSSFQLDNETRGFSFTSPRLDMRMDKRQTLDATHILNHYNKVELERIFRDYGEIREYKKLAGLILQSRDSNLNVARDSTISRDTLQNIALKIYSKSSIHPLTLIYQALRIEVNNELGELNSLLNTCENLKGGNLADSTDTKNLSGFNDSNFGVFKGVILCLISFHSLEDRIIKNAFKKWSKHCVCDESVLKCRCGGDNAKGKILYKKPLTASLQELKQNHSARSAKLRAFEFT